MDIGTTMPVFIFVTVILGGGCAYMTGQAIASTWRPVWQLVPYAMLLAAFARFLIFALFEGQLLSLTGYLFDSVILIIIAVLSFRMTRARNMVNQYPWMYDRAGLFSWREK